MITREQIESFFNEADRDISAPNIPKVEVTNGVATYEITDLRLFHREAIRCLLIILAEIERNETPCIEWRFRLNGTVRDTVMPTVHILSNISVIKESKNHDCCMVRLFDDVRFEKEHDEETLEVRTSDTMVRAIKDYISLTKKNSKIINYFDMMMYVCDHYFDDDMR